eukprot:m.362806 g.362806  ORF g.362806 m.362806 type:complete len:506 (+) comp56020_c1_seq1:313-1830(+)
MERRGVSAALVSHWRAVNPRIRTQTVQEACDALIRPQTQEQQCALIDLFADQADANGQPYVGNATAYVCHAWVCNVTDSLDVIESYEELHPGGYYWLDLFCVNQHGPVAITQDWLTQDLRNGIEGIGNVLVVAAPWEAPAVLSRTWCLWEIFAASTRPNVTLTVHIPSTMRRALVESLLSNHSVLNQALPDACVAQSQASREDDMAVLNAVIETTAGHIALERTVTEVFRQRYAQAVVDAAESLSGMKNAPVHANDMDKVLNQIALAFRDFGSYDAALEFYSRGSEITLKNMGRDHPDMAASFSNMGTVHKLKGNPDRALEYYQLALSIEIKALGLDDPATATTYNHIGGVYSEQGKFDQALEFFQKCLGIRLKVLGKDHLAVASTYFNLGSVWNNKRQLDQAIENFTACHAIRKNQLGASHPDTVRVNEWLEKLLLVLAERDLSGGLSPATETAASPTTSLPSDPIEPAQQAEDTKEAAPTEQAEPTADSDDRQTAGKSCCSIQ